MGTRPSAARFAGVGFTTFSGAGHVDTYLAFLVGADERYLRYVQLESSNDNDAFRAAERHWNGACVDVWRRGRFVARLHGSEPLDPELTRPARWLVE